MSARSSRSLTTAIGAVGFVFEYPLQANLNSYEQASEESMKTID